MEHADSRSADDIARAISIVMQDCRCAEDVATARITARAKWARTTFSAAATAIVNDGTAGSDAARARDAVAGGAHLSSADATLVVEQALMIVMLETGYDADDAAQFVRQLTTPDTCILDVASAIVQQGALRAIAPAD